MTDLNQNDAERSHWPSQGHRNDLAPPAAVVNMSSKSIAGLRPVPLAARVPGGSAPRHSHRCRLRRWPCSSSTFLRSLRSRPITALPRSYGPSDSCPPHSGTLRCNACSTSGQVSRIHALRLPAIPSPNTCGCSALSGHATPRQVEPRLHPSMGSSPNEISGLYHSLAGSPHPTGRIEFVILRTGRSPPAALHPVSRRRSCSRLQVTLTWRGLSPLRLKCALRRTRARLHACRTQRPCDPRPLGPDFYADSG